MSVGRLILVIALAGQVVTCGCGKARWDWWRKDKPQPAVRDNDVDDAPGDLPEDIDDDLLAGNAAAPRPTPSSRPGTRPADRSGWSKARPSSGLKSQSRPVKPRDSIETPILFVNDEMMTVQEVLDPIRAKLQEAAESMSPPEYRRFMFSELQRRVVHLVNVLLAYDEAKLEITEEMEPAITKAVDETEQSRINAEFGGRFSRYQAYLEANGQSRKDVRARLRREMLVRQYLKDKFLPLIRKPTRRELVKYYEKNPDEFAEPLRTEMFLIDVPYWSFLKDIPTKDRRTIWPKLRGPKRLEARRAAVDHMDRARKELESGIPFDAVARSYSFGPNAGKGGAWGLVSPGGLTGRWAQAGEVLFELEPGAVSDVTRTEEGLLLVKAGKRHDKRVIPFLEAQPVIEAKLVKQQENELETQMLNKLRRRATIGDVEAFFHALSEAAPKQPGTRYEFKIAPPAR